MTKIGRNEPCHCGSGRKYKKCCLPQEQERATAPQVMEPHGEVRTVRAEVEKIKKAAMEKQQVVRISGVLILFSTRDGDSWLLELTDGDALQLTDKGRELEVLIDENPENTLIEWTHTYACKDGKFVVESYKDKLQTMHDGYPVQKIATAAEEIRKLLPPGYAGMVHLPLEVRGESDRD